MSCLLSDELLAFAAGGLTEPKALAVEAHIDSCNECRAVLSSLASGGPAPAFGRYRIDTVLGAGGMGIVYRGFDPQLARPIAIKVVKPASDDATSRARLVREAQALARLSHPNVCHVYDVGTDHDDVWLAMELIDGVNLRQWAREARSSDEIVAALLGAAEGIAAAHAAGLIHRDVKPENVLVTRDGRAIVTDFGLARNEDSIDPKASTLASSPQLTVTGAIAGTPAYLAPEQLLGDPLDARVDQFAWGVMAWELLTGSRPFPIVFAVRVEAVRAGVQIPATLAPHVGAALARAMAAAPRDRFATMRELVGAIRSVPIPATTRPKIADHAFAQTQPVGARNESGAAISSSPSVVATASHVVSTMSPRPAHGRMAAIAGVSVALLAVAVFVGMHWTGTRVAERRTDHVATSTPAPGPTEKTTHPDPVPPTVPAATDPVAAAVASMPAATTPHTSATAKRASKTPATPRPSNTARPGEPAVPPASQLADTARTGPTASATRTPSARKPYCRSCQFTLAEIGCLFPTDFAKPDGKSSHYLDWGSVTKIENENGTRNGHPIVATMITLRGQRRTYRFTPSVGHDILETKVGALVAICPDDQYDYEEYSGGPVDDLKAAIPLSAPPRMLAAAKLGAKHIRAGKFGVAGSRGSLHGIDPGARYLINAEVEGVDGTRYRMDDYWLDVPRGMKNEDLLVPKQKAWLVVEKPVFEEVAGGTKQLVVRVAAILDEIFP